MSKKILVIRSVSFQQLDKNLKEMQARFPVSRGEFQFELLTHGHGLRRAKSYREISRLIDYDSRQNFTVFHLPVALKKSRSEPYEGIIIPVTNKTGVGFLNVLLMALRIPSRSIYFCNMTSEIWRVARRKIVTMALKASLFKFLAGVFTLPLMVIVGPVLMSFFLVSFVTSLFSSLLKNQGR